MTKARRGRAKSAAISDEEWAFLNDQPTPKETHGGFVRWSLEYNCALGTGEPVTERLWAEWSGDVLAGWLAARPGTRPRCWWRYSAPRSRLPGEPAWAPSHAEPRRGFDRRGNVIEQRCGMVLPGWDLGLPSYWAERPVIVESEAAYLDRHGLLPAAEHRRVPAGGFDPEPLTMETDHDA